MPSWKWKAVLHRLMSRLPNPHLWNELFQRYVTLPAGSRWSEK